MSVHDTLMFLDQVAAFDGERMDELRNFLVEYAGGVEDSEYRFNLKLETPPYSKEMVSPKGTFTLLAMFKADWLHQELHFHRHITLTNLHASISDQVWQTFQRSCAHQHPSWRWGIATGSKQVALNNFNRMLESSHLPVAWIALLDEAMQVRLIYRGANFRSGARRSYLDDYYPVFKVAVEEAVANRAVWLRQQALSQAPLAAY